MTEDPTVQPHHPDLFDDRFELRRARTRSSALWAAYADALGFISELADERLLNRRTRGAPLDRLLAWERRVGGRGGVEVELPAGCWSDDTQLRMAVSRSITDHGFDVESFARIELPVWPSYALGGGRASKAAATNLGKPDTLWYANTFENWTQAGGNGAAMRIQPHVWASGDFTDGHLLDVFADSICTHGHPRAIVGACFHAKTLAFCLQNGTVPDIDQCAKIAAAIGDTFYLAREHPSIGGTWLRLWEQQTGGSFESDWRRTLDEVDASLEAVADELVEGSSTASGFEAVKRRLNLTKEMQRGSGTLTSVAAVALAGISSSPYEGACAAANTLGTDTDTIGTMTGALLGAAYPSEMPPQEPMDADYLLAEADRLVAVSHTDLHVASHRYPDVLMWNAPQTQADALVDVDGSLHVLGLGPVYEVQASDTGSDVTWTSRGDFGWQWVRTSFGQTLLIKRRPEVPSLNASLDSVAQPEVSPSRAGKAPTSRAGKLHKDDGGGTKSLDQGVDIDRAVEYAMQHLDDDSLLGYTIRRVARQGSLAELVALVVALRDHLRR